MCFSIANDGQQRRPHGPVRRKWLGLHRSPSRLSHSKYLRQRLRKHRVQEDEEGRLMDYPPRPAPLDWEYDYKTNRFRPVRISKIKSLFRFALSLLTS